MQFTFAHNNFNVADLDASLAFYEKALGLREVRRHATDALPSITWATASRPTSWS